MPKNTSLTFKKHAEEGELTVDHFNVVTDDTPELKDGEVNMICLFFLAREFIFDNTLLFRVV